MWVAKMQPGPTPPFDDRDWRIVPVPGGFGELGVPTWSRRSSGFGAR